MILFNKSHPAGVFPGTPGRLNLRIAGFGRQQTVSIRDVVKAVDVLPSFHLEGLREIIYAPELVMLDPAAYCSPRPWGVRKGEFAQKTRTVYVLDFDSPALLRHILYHEIGHYVFFLVLGSRVKKHWVTQLFPGSACVTSYAATSAMEDFAETYACYVQDPEQVKRFPQKFAFMQEQVFSGRPGTLKRSDFA